MSETQLSIEGMTCAACVLHVEKALLQVPGVRQADVNLATEKVHVFYDDPVPVEALIQAVSQAGYRAKPAISARDREFQQHNYLQHQMRALQWACFFSVPLLIPMLLMPIGGHWSLSPWMQFALATPVQFWLGARFYQGAYVALRTRTGNMDLLVALGTSAAYFLSLYAVWHGAHGHALYFESSAMVITLVLLGKWLETRAKNQTSEAIRALESLRPDYARVRREQQEQDLPLEDLQVGDIVLVRAGERIPVDGKIISGHSQIDEALITGESLPVSRGPGERVTGGSLNLDGYLELQTLSLGTESFLAKVIRMVESAQSAKAPIQKLVDQISAVFVPVVMGIAALTFSVVFGMHGDFEKALLQAVAVLVIACPCALGLATPMALMVGTGLGARYGILIQDAEALEITCHVTSVVFDKTGTLTEGKPSVVKLWSPDLPDSLLLSIIAALQQGSEHPLAQAIREHAIEAQLDIPRARFLKTLAGFGVQGRLGERRLILGNLRLMQNHAIVMTEVQEQQEKAYAQGWTLSYLADSSTQQLLGMVAFSDRLKPTARATVQHLHAQGIETILLTGDHFAAAQQVASRLGIERVYAEVLPEEKVAWIQRLQQQGKTVAMIGDGINDAPALAAADVGMAMSTGTDVAMQSAGITLMRGEPLLIPDAIMLSRRTYAKIRQNLFWAFAYNVVGIPLAALGFLNPILAGAAMAFSSVSVVMNALLLRRWKPKSQVTRHKGALD